MEKKQNNTIFIVLAVVLGTFRVLATIGTIALSIVGIVELVGAIQVSEQMVATSENVSVRDYNDSTVYVMTGEYEGEYDLQLVELLDALATEDDDGANWNELEELINEFNTIAKFSYQEYADFCARWGLTQQYYDRHQNYIVIADAEGGSAYVDVSLADVLTSGIWTDVYLHEDFNGVVYGAAGYALIVPTEAELSGINVYSLYSETEYSNLLKYGTSFNPNWQTVAKPIIYLYPEVETEVAVKLGRPETLTVSYPDYDEGWRALAHPDGSLTEIATGRDLYALYYEASAGQFERTTEGFVVARNETVDFLEEKLALLGLNARETEEFIVYWLPQLEASPYNYIRFASAAEIAAAMPLEIDPAPESVIRVWMISEGLEAPVVVTPQEIVSPSRTGFVAVEWGGTRL